MPRRKETFVAGEHYHLYNRGVHRARLFHDRGEYLLFLTKWREHISPDAITVLAYCLMPNHYHLLVKAEDDRLSDHLHAFVLAFVKAWNKIREQTGAAFEGPFRAVHVDREEYLLHLTRYIHRNPLVAGMVSKAEDWEYSSYREYLRLRSGTLPVTEKILVQFAGVEHYRRFVELAPFDGSIRHLLIDDEDSSHD